MNVSTLFIIPGLIIPGILTAQDSVVTKVAGTTGRHEINIGFVNLFQRQSFFDIYPWYYSYDVDDVYELMLIQNMYGYNYLSQQYGAGYKYHFTKGAVRAYIEGNVSEFKNKSSENVPNPGDYSEYSYRFDIMGTRIGYEFIKGEGKLKFLYGADLLGQFLKSEFKSSNLNTGYSGTINYSTETNSATRYSYGIGPVLGLKYYVNNFISISTETRFDFTLFRQSGHSVYVGSGSYSVTDQDYNSSGTALKISPLGLLSLNVHLK